MAQYFVNLSKRSEETRMRAAKELQRYVSTELRELPTDRVQGELDEINQHIYQLISSSEVHEKKGGILAIGKRQQTAHRSSLLVFKRAPAWPFVVSLVSLEGNVARLGRFANYLRAIIPHPDVSLTEMVAKAIGQLALCEGTYTAGETGRKRRRLEMEWFILHVGNRERERERQKKRRECWTC